MKTWFACLLLAGATLAHAGGEGSTPIDISPHGLTAGVTVLAPTTPLEWSDCINAAKDWIGTIEKSRKKTGGKHDFTAIVFHESGAVCHRSRDYGVAGDPIYVGLFTETTETVKPKSVSFVPCELEKEDPLLPDVAPLPGFQPRLRKESDQRTPVSPLYEGRVCYNRDVTVEVVATVGGTDQTWRSPISQHLRYRGTAQAGFLSSDLHDREFTLIADSDGTQRIFDKGTVDRGPEWYANVVIYGITHYLRDLSGKTRYQGRDAVHDQRWTDRLGLFVGVSLSEPSERFSGGLSFELLAGVNVLFGYERVKVDELVGLQSGDAFPGDATSLPIRERWEGDTQWGVALDLRYVVALFKRQ